MERAKRDKEAAEQAVRKGLVAAFHEQLAKGREEEKRREEQQRARDEEDRLRRMAVRASSNVVPCEIGCRI